MKFREVALTLFWRPPPCMEGVNNFAFAGSVLGFAAGYFYFQGGPPPMVVHPCRAHRGFSRQRSLLGSSLGRTVAYQPSESAALIGPSRIRAQPPPRRLTLTIRPGRRHRAAVRTPFGRSCITASSRNLSMRRTTMPAPASSTVPNWCARCRRW
jgi:hypothetical protein